MEKAIFYPFLMFVFSITMVGGWIPTIKLWSQETFRLVISFCAGILLGAVFFSCFTRDFYSSWQAVRLFRNVWVSPYIYSREIYHGAPL